jgi:hypothetical protein
VEFLPNLWNYIWKVALHLNSLKFSLGRFIIARCTMTYFISGELIFFKLLVAKLPNFEFPARVIILFGFNCLQLAPFGLFVTGNRTNFNKFYGRFEEGWLTGSRACLCMAITIWLDVLLGIVVLWYQFVFLMLKSSTLPCNKRVLKKYGKILIIKIEV